MSDIVRIDAIRAHDSWRSFSGFANGLAVGDVITIMIGGETYRVRVTRCRILPNCITPYVEMELLQ